MIRFFTGRRAMLRALLVPAVAILAYANTAGNGFVWADDTVILRGEAILHSAGDLVRVFHEPFWAFTGAPSPAGGGYYRPVVAISYTIDHLFYDGNPAGYHVTNILLHAAVTLLLFLTLSRLFPRSRVPLLASLLFAAHPIHTEAVAWISGRTGLLATLGIVASLYMYTRHAERPPWIAGSLLAFAFGLGAKESAAILPLLVLLTAWRRRRPGKRFLSWHREGAYVVLLAAYILLRTKALGSIGTGNPMHIGPAVLLPSMLRVVAGYLRLLFLPFPLHTNDAVHLSPSPADPRAFFSLLFLAAAVYAFVRLGRGRRELPYGLAWLGISLLPFLNIFPLLHFRAERFLYLPSAGFLIAAAVLADRWGDRVVGEGKRFGLTPGMLLGLLLTLLLAFGTVARNRTWVNDRALFTDTIRKSPNAPEAYYMLGADAYRHGAYADATNLYRTALALRGGGWVSFLPVPWVYANLGFSCYKMDDLAGAEDAFRNALRFVPGMEKALLGLGLTQSALGRHDEAVATYRQILARDATDENAAYNLALEFEALDSLRLAEETYRRVITLDKDRKAAHLNLGSLLARAGRFPEALDEYRKALRIAPTDATIHFNVGLLFALAGETKGAVEALQTALELDPTYEDARELLHKIGGEETPIGGDSAGAPE